jgi:hypothetical protein
MERKSFSTDDEQRTLNGASSRVESAPANETRRRLIASHLSLPFILFLLKAT